MEPENSADTLQDAFSAFEEARFEESERLFRLVLNTAIDSGHPQPLCLEYLLVLQLIRPITTLTKLTEDPDSQWRVTELAAWATHRQLRPLHAALVLKSMTPPPAPPLLTCAQWPSTRPVRPITTHWHCSSRSACSNSWSACNNSWLTWNRCAYQL
jgi:hypothetical protein